LFLSWSGLLNELFKRCFVFIDKTIINLKILTPMALNKAAKKIKETK